VQQSPEMIANIARWRAKQAAGTMTAEDWRDAMSVLRDARRGAQSASARSKASKAPVNVSALKESLKSLRKVDP